MKIIGQQLMDCGNYFAFREGLGCGWPGGDFELSLWSGLGPHSAGGRMQPNQVNERDILACGAAWFLPVLEELKRAKKVSPDDVEQAHRHAFGRPMVEMTKDTELIQDFNAHVKAGKPPSSFFTACRIVKWDPEKGLWIQLFST